MFKTEDDFFAANNVAREMMHEVDNISAQPTHLHGYNQPAISQSAVEISSVKAEHV